jgi:hypothetical protein
LVVAASTDQPVLPAIAPYYAAAAEILGHHLLDGFVIGRLFDALTHAPPRCGTRI